jgi:hypothetical protein
MIPKKNFSSDVSQAIPRLSICFQAATFYTYMTRQAICNLYFISINRKRSKKKKRKKKSLLSIQGLKLRNKNAKI